MSLQTRLASLISAIGTDIKALNATVPEVYIGTNAPSPRGGKVLWVDTDEVTPDLTVSYVSVLPTSPVNGQEIYFVADAINGVLWHLRYNTASASIYKWERIGGPSLVTESSPAGDESTASASYVALTTPTTLAIPLAGDYDIETSCHGRSSVTGQMMVSYDVGATAAIDADAAGDASQTAGSGSLILRRLKRKTIPAAVTLTVKYRTAATSTFTVFGTVTIPGATRMIRATPVRVG